MLHIRALSLRGAVIGFQQRLKTMELAAYSLGSGFNLSGDGTAVHINGTETTTNLFSVLKKIHFSAADSMRETGFLARTAWRF